MSVYSELMSVGVSTSYIHSLDSRCTDISKRRRKVKEGRFRNTFPCINCLLLKLTLCV